MKKLILTLCALLVITCSAVTAEEENKDNCYFIELENGEVVEICDDDLDISPCGLGGKCGPGCF